MESPLDLYCASREDLIAVIMRQREQIAALEQRLASQEAELATQRAALEQLQTRVGTLLMLLAPPADDDVPTRPTTMPGLKPAARRRSPVQPRPPRKPRARGYGRKRMRPTARQIHAYAQCPQCGTPLRGGTPKRRREVIEWVPARVAVTEHVYVERRCPRCRGRWQPGPELAGVVLGQRRLGVGLLSLIAVLREELRLPMASIQWYLAEVHGLRLSVGAIVEGLHTVAARAAPVVAGIREGIRASPVLHVDETGWRQDGHNGYAWTFSTPTERVFVRGGRDHTVLEQAIGDDYPGVLVSDFYAVYTGYEGRHQYCWAHLLRDVEELAEQFRDDATVWGWADAVHTLYQRACATARDEPDARARRSARQRYETELGALCAPYLGPTEAPQRVLCERITTHLSALFVFVEDPTVPPTNNAAERSLRHLVTARKISGGTRSPAGTATTMTLATLFGTWRLQGLDPLAECRALLASPQV
jgi:transposase